MRKAAGLLVLCVLLLSGCGAVPQSREVGSSSVVGVLGLEPQDQGLRLYAAAEGRSGEPPSIYQGHGETPAAAIADLTDSGERVVDCAHVEHIILSQEGAGNLEEVLSYAFRDTRQSSESQLWLVRTEDLSQVFQGDKDPAKRLSVLKTAGKEGQGFRPLTLREAASALASGEALLIPALDQTEDGLVFGGYGLYRQGKIAAWLTGELALGASLLRGDHVRWTASVEDRSVSLRSAGLRAEPVWEGDRLTGLSLECRLEGIPTGGWETLPEDERTIALQTARAMNAALRVMQQSGEDAAGLKSRAGIQTPTRWRALSNQWAEVFPALQVTIDLPITTAERY